MKLNRTRRNLVWLVALFAALADWMPTTESARKLEPIVFTVKFPAPETHFAEVIATVPTEKRARIELMMPIWSPGFYRVEDYAGKVQELTARTSEGKPLPVEQPQKNRWRIQTSGASSVIVSYRLFCNSRSVTTNWVGEDLAVLNGAATFVTLAEKMPRPHDIRLELPSTWKQSMAALESTQPNQFRAQDFDTLVDSPIVVGNLSVREFDVAGSKHLLVDAGDYKQWDAQRGAQEIEKIVRATHQFWGFLPFKRYVFLNVFRQGGGGLEHKDSTLLTSSPRMTAPGYGWLGFVSHEYFHAFNVKRLRPVELGPFDYEHPPNTASLWISEGLTTYFGELLVARADIGTTQESLNSVSSHIRQLQTSPGRLLQTLEDSSLDVWNSGTSGVGRDTATKVSYYVKGPVVGLLLDAHIQRLTGGKKSLDDVMRLAYKRYSGTRGFTAEQFRKTTEEVAKVDLKDWFRKVLASTEELDYNEALDWYGLRFSTPDEKQPAKNWSLEIREDATSVQKSHLQRLLGQTGK